MSTDYGNSNRPDSTPPDYGNSGCTLPPNPYQQPGTLFGMKVVIVADVPRYVLPEEVAPGIGWPPGFREEINAWSRNFLGMTNPVPKGTALVINGSTMQMRPEDYTGLKGLI